jgi:hypothetical protein
MVEKNRIIIRRFKHEQYSVRSKKRKKLVLLVKHMRNSTMKKSRKLGKQMYITRHFAIALE